jgi:hypothetical protein
MEKVLVSVLNETDANVRLEFAIARAEVALRAVNIASAAQYSAIEATLREARECPELYLGDAVHHVATDRVEFAERAAVADLAVRFAACREHGQDAGISRHRVASAHAVDLGGVPRR